MTPEELQKASGKDKRTRTFVFFVSEEKIVDILSTNWIQKKNTHKKKEKWMKGINAQNGQIICLFIRLF